ncbi:hypothetical protein [Kineococcus sp. NPDC059986]|uniref:hypothetical protein n=1 Tax=Actinomycetes TaxID=1760 RepID=UPI00344FCDE2
MSDEFNFQLSSKLHTGGLVNIRAVTAEEFADHLKEFEGDLTQLVADTDATLVSASRVAAGGLTGVPVAAPPAAPQGYQGGYQAPAQGGFVPPAANAGGDKVLEGTDRYGNRYYSGHPKAPMTNRGPALLKFATSQQGKPYAVFVDPCKGTQFRGDRKPADLFPDDYNTARGITE